MSRTDTYSKKAKSPFKYFITFSGKDGMWEYWDGEKKEDVRLDKLEFVVLDVRSSITGWSDSNKGRIYSNMVKSTVRSPLTAKSGSTVIASGLYSEIKNQLVAAGGKFTANVLAVARINGQLVPVNIQFAAACLRDWSAFVTENNIFEIYKHLVVSEKGEQQKKGAVKYYTPEFKLEALSDEDAALADEFDISVLKPYLDGTEA